MGFVQWGVELARRALSHSKKFLQCFSVETEKSQVGCTCTQGSAFVTGGKKGGNRVSQKRMMFELEVRKDETGILKQ